MKEKYYWLNEDSLTFLKRGYLLENEDPFERFKNIAETAEKFLGIEGFADKFLDYYSRGFYSLASPILSNFGRKRGLPISCFGSYIDDKMDAILEKVAEVGQMTKAGGGTSAFFGELRGRGEAISSGGTSTGPVHFMELFDTLMSVVSQGNVRRGSFAAYLPIDHPDIEEFLKIKDIGNSIQELSIGVCISDEWMKKMIEGDKQARKIWGKVIKKRFESGYPYLFFSDTANNNAPQVYKDKGKNIHASNLCVAPETILLTKDGSFPIFQLEGKTVEVWNGEQWSETVVVKTGENQELNKLKIVFSVKKDGRVVSDDYLREIETTPYHKFFLSNGDEIRCDDLKNGDQLLSMIDPKGYEFSYRVFEVRKSIGFSATYCVNEPLKNRAVFNDILTGNCNEIMLSSEPDESFVCCLSSLNLERWDELKYTDAIETMVCFLDAVMSEFIEKTADMKFMEAARKFAINQRALGMGVLGWHSLLQSKRIAFESMDAKFLNSEIWEIIRGRADKASEDLAKLLGEPPLLEGYGRRNTTTIAIAPTTSSSFVLGQVSPSIEPLNSNYYVKDLAKGKFTYKNPYLKEVLAEKNKDNNETWKSILSRGGSVQHLEFLSEEEKDVFKTFSEISQKEIIIQASQRQKKIDQGQSLNLQIPASATPKEVSQLLIFAWEMGIKGCYYQRSSNPSQELARSIMSCKSCEG